MATINSGITMRIIPRSFYDFSKVQSSQVLGFALAQHIEAAQFTEADLLVRLHTPTVMSAGQNLQVALQTDGYDFDDPTGIFTGGTPLCGLSQTGAPTLPFYGVYTAAAGTAFGRLLTVSIAATQPASAATFQVYVSVDLVLKGGDPNAMPMSPNSYRGYRIM